MKNMFLKIYSLMVLLISSVSLYGSNVIAEIEYFYADDGTLMGKAFNGKRVNFEYDLRGQLLAVTDASGNDLERYTYDPAGNRLSKTINGVTTTYSYDEANQLIRSTVNGEITYYEYDAAGRMIQAGDKSYIYNGNNKVSEVRQNGETIAKFEYNIDGQIAKAIYGDKKEEFIWDGLALIWRSGVTYINEPYVTGGNPVMAGDDVLFNDMLGSTLAVNDKAVEMTSFGETDNENAFFTGKPMIDELGYSFLFRDYNPNQGKWTTSDPLGYPNGWNALAYCGNMPQLTCDYLGCVWWNPLDWISWLFDSDDEKYIKDTKFEELSCSVLDNHHVSLVCGLGSEGKWKWTPSVTWAYNAELGLHPMGIGELNIKVNVKSQESLEYTIPAYKCSSKKHDFSGTLDYDLEVRFTVAKCIVTYSDGSTEEKLVGDYQIMAVNLKHKNCE